MKMLDWQEQWLNTPNKNIIWAETGLGKGVLLSYYATLYEKNGVLIITPPHLIYDWIDKIEQNGYTASIVNKGELKSGINVVSYSMLTRYKLNSKGVGLIIIDESHRIKSHKSTTFKIIQSYVKKYTPEVICISATIVTKNSIDILTQAYITNKAVMKYQPSFYKFLEDVSEFKEMYFGSKIVRTPIKVKPEILKSIMKTVFVVTYEKEGIPKPEYKKIVIKVKISTEAEDAVNTFLDTEQLLSNPSFSFDYILNKISNPHSTFLQAVNGFIYKKDENNKVITVECGIQKKVEQVLTILEEEKPLLLYFFDAEKEVLKGIPNAYIYKKDGKGVLEQIQEFEKGVYSCFIANIASIGEGIRFKNTSSVIIFSQQYDYGRLLQAMGRIMYVGDTKEQLRVYTFKSDYKYSKDIDLNLYQKQQLIQELR